METGASVGLQVAAAVALLAFSLGNVRLGNPAPIRYLASLCGILAGQCLAVLSAGGAFQPGADWSLGSRNFAYSAISLAAMAVVAMLLPAADRKRKWGTFSR